MKKVFLWLIILGYSLSLRESQGGNIHCQEHREIKKSMLLGNFFPIYTSGIDAVHNELNLVNQLTKMFPPDMSIGQPDFENS